MKRLALILMIYCLNLTLLKADYNWEYKDGMLCLPLSQGEEISKKLNLYEPFKLKISSLENEVSILEQYISNQENLSTLQKSMARKEKVKIISISAGASAVVSAVLTSIFWFKLGF